MKQQRWKSNEIEIYHGKHGDFTDANCAHINQNISFIGVHQQRKGFNEEGFGVRGLPMDECCAQIKSSSATE